MQDIKVGMDLGVMSDVSDEGVFSFTSGRVVGRGITAVVLSDVVTQYQNLVKDTTDWVRDSENADVVINFNEEPYNIYFRLGPVGKTSK